MCSHSCPHSLFLPAAVAIGRRLGSPSPQTWPCLGNKTGIRGGRCFKWTGHAQRRSLGKRKACSAEADFVFSRTAMIFCMGSGPVSDVDKHLQFGVLDCAYSYRLMLLHCCFSCWIWSQRVCADFESFASPSLDGINTNKTTNIFPLDLSSLPVLATFSRSPRMLDHHSPNPLTVLISVA